MNLAAWIADYATYLESNGYASQAIGIRLKHLSYLNRFIEARGLKTLEEFAPELASDFIDYWINHHPTANKSAGFSYKSRFEPHHHRDVQFSLRSFFRWAHATGRLQHNAFPLAPPVRGDYFFPEIVDYLHFCEEHKGLAKNSLVQIERFVRRFDQFLHSVGLTAWNQLQSSHFDLFVSQQASHNIGRIQLIHALLRGLLRYLFSLDRLDRDWACALRSPRRYQLAHTPRALSVEQVLLLLRRWQLVAMATGPCGTTCLLHRARGNNLNYNQSIEVPGDSCWGYDGNSHDSGHSTVTKEYSLGAFNEGFAHFYAVCAWNFLEYDGWFVSFDGIGAPVKDVENGTRYMKTACAPPFFGYGNEVDWMRFFWDFRTDAGTRPTFTDILNLISEASPMADMAAYEYLLWATAGYDSGIWFGRFVAKAEENGINP